VSDRFWAWYERHYTLNVTVAAALFLLQVAHLVWLTGQVVVARLTGEAVFTLAGTLRWPLVLVDYTEVPALLSVSLVYVNELRRHWDWRPVAMLVLLNSQWLHIFWITDEFVASSFEESSSSALPSWLAWVAILIDYLEVPVMVDTAWRAVEAVRRGGSGRRRASAPLGPSAE
jgi:hypothetical protein